MSPTCSPSRGSASERTPLLVENTASHPSTTPLASTSAPPTATPPASSPPPAPPSTSLTTWLRLPHFTTTHPRFSHVPLIGCLLILTNEAEFFFKQAATMRAVESLYCIEYYTTRDPSLAHLGRSIPERLCKADEIQKDVAALWAKVMLCRMVCAMVATIPLGRLADLGRRRVLILHKTGVLLSTIWPLIVYTAYPALPIWTFWVGSAASIIGGNFDLGLAVLFAAYTDVVPDPAQRTALFFLTTAMQYVGQAVCPPIGGLFMNLDGRGGTAWASMLLGAAMGLICWLLAIFCFPETLERSEPLDVAERGRERDEPVKEGRVSLWKATRSTLKAWADAIVTGLHGLGIVNTLALAASILLVQIGVKAIDWFGLSQYPVIRLGWTYTQASAMPSLQAIVTIILFFLILPLLTPHLPPLAIMAFSLVLIIVGALLLGLASTAPLFMASMTLYTLGAGFSVTAQSYISSRIATDKLARVLAVLSIASTGGKVLASAAWPPLLGWGLDNAAAGTEIWKGLPLFVAAAGFALAGLGVGFVAGRERIVSRRKGKGRTSV